MNLSPNNKQQDSHSVITTKEIEMIKIKTENIIFLDIDNLKKHLPKEYFMRLIKRWSDYGNNHCNFGISHMGSLVRIMELNLKDVEIPIDEQEKVKLVIEAVKKLNCDMVHEGFWCGE